MRHNSYFARFWTRLRAEVIQDVPPNIEECESCREGYCTQERWLSCARRLAAEAEHGGAGDYLMPSDTGRSDEMPGICATDETQSIENETAESETSESVDDRKNISFSSK